VSEQTAGTVGPGAAALLSRKRDLMLSRRATQWRRVTGALGHALLFIITSSSALAVLFIFIFIARYAFPFFFAGDVSLWARVREFFGSTQWYPTQEPAVFGALAIFFGSALVTTGAVLVAVPLGVAAAVCLSDVLPFWLRQYVKPVIEVLAAIPSVAYGFFALVVFAPLLQDYGGAILTAGWLIIAVPLAGLAILVLGDVGANWITAGSARRTVRIVLSAILTVLGMALVWVVAQQLLHVTIDSGRNALNVSVILGIMALPTVVSVSEDALQAVGRDLREGAYALGSTRAETLTRVVIPAASSGICAAVILGVMRAIGETMVVWMASGNAARIPEPFYNVLQPIRTLTATIAGEMGEADQSMGSDHYHVLFAMALALLTISFVLNTTSEWVTRRSVK
jgi:phosphate transport system permease protein